MRARVAAQRLRHPTRMERTPVYEASAGAHVRGDVEMQVCEAMDRLAARGAHVRVRVRRQR